MQANNTTIEKKTFLMPPSYPDGATEPNLLNALEKPERIQKIVQEGILLAGGAVAILLQVAMPGVRKGVDEYSNFSYRSLDRLRNTMTYMYCMVFGTQEVKKIVIDMAHRAHSVVQGQDYSADDPELQVWVGIDLYEQVFGRMSEEAAEGVYREYAILAVSLRVKPGMWPQDRRAFWIYWDAQIEKIQNNITPNAKNVAKNLLFSKRVPLKIRLVLPLVRLMTADMLPDRIREEYGLKTGKCRQEMQGIVKGLTKATYPATPKFIRTYPLWYYMKDIRRRTKNAKRYSICLLCLTTIYLFKTLFYIHMKWI